MDERLRFVARLLEGEKMAPLCAEFGISRKTGYKIFDRYKDCGVAALTDRSRRPYRQANRLPAPLEAMIVRLKREYPGWGAPKIREKLRRQSTAPHLPGDQHRACGARSPRPGPAAPPPAARARPAPRSRGRPCPTRCGVPTTKVSSCSGNRRYCYPLTITDFASRYLLTCEALSTTQEKFAFTVFERTFKEFGLPQRDPDRQRRPVRVRPRALRPQQTVGVVAAARHSDRADSARPPATEWPPRADASDAEAGGHQAGRPRTSCSSRRASTPSSTSSTTSGRTRRSA